MTIGQYLNRVYDNQLKLFWLRVKQNLTEIRKNKV